MPEELPLPDQPAGRFPHDPNSGSAPGSDSGFGRTPARLLGSAYNIADLRAAAARTEQILDSMAVAYLAMDEHRTITCPWRISAIVATALALSQLENRY